MRNKKVTFVLGAIAGIALLSFLNFCLLQDENGQRSIHYPQNYQIVTPYIPSSLSFCGEEVPMDNYEVKERIEREFIVNSYRHSSTLLYIKRANRWFPIIEKILDKNNIPEDFKFLAVAESGLDNVTFPAGAKGYWQFIKSAGKRYGLEINSEVDERYHLEKATEAACKYFKEGYDKYGSWTLAAASYNRGMNGITKQLNKQKTNNYYNLVLGEETSRYIARIVTLKAIMENPELYGFRIKDEELYPELETYTVKVKSNVTDLADFAKKHGINYKILKMYNPWLRDNLLKNKNNKTYSIKIPAEGSIYVIPERE